MIAAPTPTRDQDQHYAGVGVVVKAGMEGGKSRGEGVVWCYKRHVMRHALRVSGVVIVSVARILLIGCA